MEDGGGKLGGRLWKTIGIVDGRAKFIALTDGPTVRSGGR